MPFVFTSSDDSIAFVNINSAESKSPASASVVPMLIQAPPIEGSISTADSHGVADITNQYNIKRKVNAQHMINFNPSHLFCTWLALL